MRRQASWNKQGAHLLALFALATSLLQVESVATTPVFLSDKLPLRVLSVLPTSSQASTRLYGRTALTVVYARPVIALGSDWSASGNDGVLAQNLVPFTLQACSGQPAFAVPGKLRWATTSIARFDADIDWPTDLCFDLVLNMQLKTFDGLSFASDSFMPRPRFTTAPVTLSVSYVRSDVASSLTSGRWTSQLFDAESSVHEVPPDALVYLSFSSDLDHATAFASLREANSALLSTSDTYDNCGSKCLVIRPRNLQNAMKYELKFPKGKPYSTVAGSAGEELKVSLTGLVPFSFPFFYKTIPRETWKQKKLQYRRHHLYLRHGLASGSRVEQLQKLKAVVTVTSGGVPLDFSLSLVDNATLQIELAASMPSTQYAISVGASSEVLDGYQQPLTVSSMEYATADWPNDFRVAKPTGKKVIRFANFSYGWTALSRGKGNTFRDYDASGNPVVPVTVNAWPVLVEDVPKALATMYSSTNYLSAATKVTLTAPTNRNELQVLAMDRTRLLKASTGHHGLFLQYIKTYSSGGSKNFVSSVNFGVAFIATSTNELLVWATKFDTRLPVSGASVSVYYIASTYRAFLSDVTLVASGSTGSDGTVTLSPTAVGGLWKTKQYGGTLVAVVNAGDNQIAIAEGVQQPWKMDSDEVPTRAELITDRRIYKPGDKVHLKGFVRMLNSAGTGYTLPTADYDFAAEVQWKRSSKDPPMRVPASLQMSHGTVSVNLTVPTNEGDVTFGDVSLSIVLVPKSGSVIKEKTIATTTITVADPRPPTVSLKLSTNTVVVQPGTAAALNLSIRAATYTGVGVEGAKIVLTWSVQPAPRFSSGIRNGGVIGLQDFVVAGSSSASALPGKWRPSQTHWSSWYGSSSTVTSANPTGQVEVTTTADGMLNYTLDLATLLKAAGEGGGEAPPCSEGDTVSVTAQWVGPTREVVNADLEEGKVKVARSPFALVITPSTPVSSSGELPLPGTPFSVYIDIQDQAGKSVSWGQQQRAVTLSLHEWDGEAAIRQDASTGTAMTSGLLPSASWGTQVGGSCQVFADAGLTAQCATTLTLPAAKKYVVLAQATDPTGVDLVTAFAVGKTQAEWDKRPLSALDARSFDSQLVARADKQAYTVGQKAVVSLVTPFSGAKVLVVWGNGAKRRTLQKSLTGPAGVATTIEVEVDDGCAFGCKALIVLVAPSQAANVLLPVPVPISPLLDITSPQSMSTTVTLNVPDTGRAFADGTVQVAVTQANGDAIGASVQPGSKAAVKVTAPAGSEACIFVVDKAMLDVGGPANPHVPTELSTAFELKRGDDYRYSGADESLSSQHGSS
jgi:hypothetical protein